MLLLDEEEDDERQQEQQQEQLADAIEVASRVFFEAVIEDLCMLVGEPIQSLCVM